MNCKYSTKEEADSVGRHFLICKIEQGRCPLVRYCPTMDDIRNTDNYTDCTVMKKYEIEKGRNDMNNKVIFEKKGSLYIELNDEIGQVVAIKNPYDKIPDYVDLVFVDNTPYIKGFEPKKEKTYTRKADIKDGSK